MSRASSLSPVLSSLLVAAGGPEPGLCTFRADTAQVEPLVGLPIGRSVYAVNISAAGDMLAIGDRLGGIEVRSWWQAAGQARLVDVASLNQGAAILSLCLLDDRHLAVADVAGRCLLWQVSDPTAPPMHLEVDGAVICSLVRLGQGQMLGLSADGRLLLWSTSDGGLIGTIPGPRPPRQLSLVRLCPWPALGAVVYSAADGSLMTCRFDDPSPKGRPAHDGAFYACIVVGDRLYSIGSQDGRLKVWQADGRKPIEEYAVARGIVSGQIVPDDSGRLLLVDRRGTAGIYSLGAILLDILNPAGQPPSETGCELVPRDRTYRPPKLGADLDLNEGRVVRRCLAADPARRYQTVGELLDDLDGRGGRQQAVAEATDLWQAACSCVAESDLVGAARMCGRLVRDYPGFAEAGAMLQEIRTRDDQAGKLYAVVERGMNSWPLADLITVLGEAIAIYPDHPAGLPVQIQLEIRTRQYRDAMATGLGLAGRGRWQTARTWFDRARQFNPGAMAAEAPAHFVATVLDHVGQTRALIDDAMATGHWDRAMRLARQADRYAETTAHAISSPRGGPGQWTLTRPAPRRQTTRRGSATTRCL